MEVAPPTASGGAAVTLDWGDVAPDRGVEARGAVAGHDLVIVGHGRIVRQHKGSLVVAESTLAPADVGSLADAVRDQRRCCAVLPEPIFVGRGSPESFDEEIFDADPVHLEVGEGYIHAVAEAIIARPSSLAADYREWLDTAARRHSCSVVEARLTDRYGSDPEDFDWPEGFEDDREVYLAAERTRPRIAIVRVAPAAPMAAGRLLSAGRDVQAVLDALAGGPLGASTAAHLLRAGLPHLLLGLAENEWLEVKGQPYSLDAPGPAGVAAKIELAQDVARFANGDVHAVLVIGLTSRKRAGRDMIDAVRPAKLSALLAERHQAVVDDRVYPTIEGLSVERVDLGHDRGLLVIEVPAQPDQYKPFLVHGAIVGNRIEGAFISIVRRRGERSIPTHASQIHAMLAAGRALLRGDRA